MALCPAADVEPPVGEWKPLFDGKSLDGWKKTPFDGTGEVSVEDGTILLQHGSMTGVTWQGDFPKSNYEVSLEATRLAGMDFFAGITFPVQDSYCSWIVGGWGGQTVGLSEIDYFDASANETTLLMEFEYRRWYHLYLQVTDDAIRAWIDGEQVVGVLTKGRKIGLRPGPIKLSVPFGIATYATTGALRNIEYRRIPPE
jgi:hypothetical protein